MQLAHRPALRVERNYEIAAIVVETLKNWTVNMKSFTKTLSSQLVDTSGAQELAQNFPSAVSRSLRRGIHIIIFIVIYVLMNHDN